MTYKTESSEPRTFGDLRNSRWAEPPYRGRTVREEIRADALAVISQPDRERFYGLFEQFIQRSGMRLVQARKAASKLTRR